MNNVVYKVGDIVEMKKPHPCATHSKQWKILDLSGDVQMKCMGCGCIVFMKRFDFDKRVVKVIKE